MRSPRAWAPLLALALVAGCVTPPARELPDDPSLTRVSDPEARRLLAEGDVRAAADIYSDRAALATDAAQREDYQLLAAEILFDRGMLEPALERLDAVTDAPSTPLLAQRRDILVAKGLLFGGDPEAALLALPDPADVEASIHRARIQETRAQIYRRLDDPDNELVARIAGPFLCDADAAAEADLVVADENLSVGAAVRVGDLRPQPGRVLRCVGEPPG